MTIASLPKMLDFVGMPQIKHGDDVWRLRIHLNYLFGSFNSRPTWRSKFSFLTIRLEEYGGILEGSRVEIAETLEMYGSVLDLWKAIDHIARPNS